MKKILKKAAAITLTLPMILSLTAGVAFAEEKQELVVATWGGTTATNMAEVSKAFEEEYNCTVIFDEAGSNADRLNKVREQKDDPQIDVVFITDCFAVIGNEEGLFAEIDPEIVTNLSEIYDFAKYDGNFGPGYSLTRYGIIYNTDIIDNPPTSYMALFDDEYAGEVSLPAMSSTAGPMILVTIAEELSGKEAADLTEEDIQAAFDFIEEKKDNIAQWYTNGAEVISAFSSGEVSISVFMDMFVPVLQGSGVNVEWQDADEGTFEAMATINVVAGSKNEELAQQYVNFFLGKELQSTYAELAYEAPVNKNAEIGEEFKKYLAFGEDAINGLKQFDLNFLNGNKEAWIEAFNKIVAS